MRHAPRTVIGLLAAFVLAVAGAAFAGPEETFQEGIRNYTAENYEAAALIFRDLAQEHPRNAEVWYNLGCTFFRMEDLPRAIWAFERAAQLDPTSTTITENLALARQAVFGEQDRTGANQDNATTRLINRLLSTGTINQVTMLCLALWLGIGILGSWAIWVGESPLRGKLIAGMIVLAVLLVPGIASLSYQLYEASDLGEGIILQPEVELRSEPRTSAEGLYKVDGGLKVRVTDQVGKFYYVESLQFDAEGWVSADDLGLL